MPVDNHVTVVGMNVVHERDGTQAMGLVSEQFRGPLVGKFYRPVLGDKYGILSIFDQNAVFFLALPKRLLGLLALGYIENAGDDALAAVAGIDQIDPHISVEKGAVIPDPRGIVILNLPVFFPA